MTPAGGASVPPAMLEDLRRDLRAAAEPDRVPQLERYFQAFPGGYGEGDVFLGVRVPAARAIAKRHAALPLQDVASLLRSDVHDERLVALLLLARRAERGDEDERSAVLDIYLAGTASINNWDLVDASAPAVVGRWVLDHDTSLLDTLAGSDDLWERRIAMIATLRLIRAGELDPTYTLAERLLSDDHDLMHKACGWMLREAGKRDERRLVAFIETHAARMPRTMLRYAIERLPADERARLLAL
ncbi:MAG: DNA alkylation repair protein [Baekduiaceae bacterium]